jgi:hypothetical protein
VNLPAANFSATVDSELLLETTQPAILGGLAADAGATLTITGDAPDITVNRLGGSGSIAYGKNLTVLGVAAPGGDTPGTLTVTGNVELDTSSALEIDIMGNAADRLTVIGLLDIEAEENPQPTLLLKAHGGTGELFTAGTYVLAEGTTMEGTFASVEGLGSYLPEGSVSYADNKVTATIALNLNPGDANLDTETDVLDFNIWNANKFTSGTEWRTGDFNGDSVTDLSDFNIWNANKFTSAPDPTPARTEAVDDVLGTDATLQTELAWLSELLDSESTSTRPDDGEKSDKVTDKVLAYYW